MNLGSLNFLAPGAFFLGLLLPVIVALYLLKLRRIERPVPSTFLWRKMVRDVEANAPWQKLRANLLMILQLLFLIALIFALARPFTYAEGITGTAAIFIIDSSASMASTDVQPSRIESAKQRAGQLIDDLPGSARVTVIDAGKEAKVLASSSLDRRQAHLAVDGIRAGTGGSDMSVALELASAIAARQPGTEIVVLSDGGVELPQRIALKGRLRYIPFGLSGENQAVSLLTLEPAPGGKSLTAFAQVSNYGDKRVDRRLSLYADGQLVNAFDLAQIPTGGQRSVIAEGLPPETRQIEAKLDGTDALPLDDQAVAVKPDTQPVPVTLITQGNQFLKTALSLMPGVVLTEQESAPMPEGTPTAGPTPTSAPTATATATAIAASSTTSNSPAALTIYDNVLPDVLPTSGSLLFIAPPRSTEYFTTTGVVKDPALRVIDPNDPLAANIALDQVAIQQAVNIPLPSWATPVIAGDTDDGANVPLLFRGEVNGRRIAVLSFSTHVQNSDMALQVAFPLMVSNLVDWLVPGAGSAVPAQVAPGAALSFTTGTGTASANNGAQSASVTRPDGSSVPLSAEKGRFIFTDTNQLGVYQVNLPGAESASSRQAAFAVNLFSPKESTVKPADNLPNVSAESTVAGGASEKAAREWWRPVALLALGLLTGEWLVYQRAALARLRDRLLRRAPALRFGKLK